MMEHQGADAGLRVHHHAFGKLDADFFRAAATSTALLIVEIRARRIAEAVALAAIARREALLHRHRRRIGKAPVFADAAVQPLGAAFGRLDGQGLQRRAP